MSKIHMLLNRYEGVEWRTRWHTCVWLGRSKGLIKFWSLFTTLCSYCGGAKGLRNIVKGSTEPRVQCFYLCQLLEWWQVVNSKPSVHCFQAVARPFSNKNIRVVLCHNWFIYSFTYFSSVNDFSIWIGWGDVGCLSGKISGISTNAGRWYL